MPNFNQFPLQGTLLNQSTGVTTSGTSSATSLPMCESYRFFLEMATFTATNLTLDVYIATSADGGTTYNEIFHFAQTTTSGQGRTLLVRPFLGTGDAATEGAAANLTNGQDLAAGSTAVVTNGPFDPRYIKVRWVTGAAVTTCIFNVKWIGVPPGNAV